ncbi:MAG TPA: hydrogenase expression/formation C-terminal domain-containing protein [Steroidobacteraceae bacterium]|nr:hydrogenase expression/formation C-terminal domain-containing protein [Steroidobacteraceae bacterium]
MRTEAQPGLAGIPLVVEAGPMVHVDSGNVPLLLHELRHALDRLLADGTTHVIDLRAIPLGPGEEERLLETLGTGEVRAEFTALGRSVIEESSYPGLWQITHWNTADEMTGRFLEVAFTPALLSSPPEDVNAGLARLMAALNG